MSHSPNGSGVWALLPVKRAETAKTRLASILTLGERQALQRAMLRDVLNGVSQARLLEGIAVISADRIAGEIAPRHGAIYIPESPECGNLNFALELGARRLRGAGARVIAIIPADVPLIDGAELDRAVELSLRLETTIVVPDRHGQGTNALIFPAEAAPPFEFGPGSFQRHLARKGSVPAVALELRSMELDIDTPGDVGLFSGAAGSAALAPRTHGVLSRARARRESTVCEDV